MATSDRRSLLKWTTGFLAACSSSIVGLPAASHVLGSLRHRDTGKAEFRRVGRLDDFAVGRPVLMAVVGERRDGWTVHANETIGRVWIVRDADAKSNPAQATVRALSAVCPHLRCTIQLTADGHKFACPCHGAAFAKNGERIHEAQSTGANHAPRDMDPLECRVVQDAQTQEWWVEVKYQSFEQGRTSRVVVS